MVSLEDRVLRVRIIRTVVMEAVAVAAEPMLAVLPVAPVVLVVHRAVAAVAEVVQTRRLVVMEVLARGARFAFGLCAGPVLT